MDRRPSSGVNSGCPRPLWVERCMKWGTGTVVICFAEEGMRPEEATLVFKLRQAVHDRAEPDASPPILHGHILCHKIGLSSLHGG